VRFAYFNVALTISNQKLRGLMFFLGFFEVAFKNISEIKKAALLCDAA
jgi:hypothetical protein